VPLDRGEVAAGHGLSGLRGEGLHWCQILTAQGPRHALNLLLAGDQLRPCGGKLSIRALGAGSLGQIHRRFQVLPQGLTYLGY
jgi:hypothetical protein